MRHFDAVDRMVEQLLTDAARVDPEHGRGLVNGQGSGDEGRVLGRRSRNGIVEALPLDRLKRESTALEGRALLRRHFLVWIREGRGKTHLAQRAEEQFLQLRRRHGNAYLMESFCGKSHLPSPPSCLTGTNS